MLANLLRLAQTSGSTLNMITLIASFIAFLGGVYVGVRWSDKLSGIYAAFFKT